MLIDKPDAPLTFFFYDLVLGGMNALKTVVLEAKYLVKVSFFSFALFYWMSVFIWIFYSFECAAVSVAVVVTLAEVFYLFIPFVFFSLLKCWTRIGLEYFTLLDFGDKYESASLIFSDKSAEFGTVLIINC